MNMKKIGVFLKALRREKGLTQEQLAEALFVSGKTVSRWETGVSHNKRYYSQIHAYMTFMASDCRGNTQSKLGATSA